MTFVRRLVLPTIDCDTIAAVRVAAVMAGAMLALAVSPATALTIRGDELWRSNQHCPPGWSDPDTDDSAWAYASYPWRNIWPKHWEVDPAARVFWGRERGNTCVRRRFHLSTLPPPPVIAYIWVDDDYEFYLNGKRIAANADRLGMLPGEAYDVSSALRAGDNVVALRLLDHGGVMGALFSLTVPGAPVPLTWSQIGHRALPWLNFLALVGLLIGIGQLVYLLRTALGSRLFRAPPRGSILLILLLAIAAQTALATQTFYRGLWDQPLSAWNWPAVIIASLLVCLLIATCGAARTPRAVPIARGTERRLLWSILLLAIILRTVWLDGIPVGFFQDEAHNANDAHYLFESYPERGLQIWSDSIGGRPTLFLYALGGVIHLLGAGYLALKVVPVCVGVGGVAAVYAVGRVAFGARIALWAAFFLAVSRWHIHYSRMAWEAICVPLFSAGGLALLLYGYRHRRHSVPSLVAGLVISSLGLYTYAAYRAVPAVAVVFLLVLLASKDRRRVLRRDRVVGILAGGAVAVCVALPLVRFAWHEPARYWERYTEVSLTSYMSYFGTPFPWVHMIGKALLSFNGPGDPLIRHNLSGAAHLDALTGVLFLIGAGTAVWARKTIGMRLLWTWCLVFLALATLTREGPHATRLLGLAPVAALFAALGANRLLAALAGPGDRLRHGLTALLIAIPLALNGYQYFVVEANHPDADLELNLIGRVLCEHIRGQHDVDVYWTPEISFFADAQCRFLARGRFRHHDLTIERARDPASMRHDGPVLAVIGQEFLDDHRKEIARAPDGRPLLDLPAPSVQRDRSGRVLYYLYRL